MEFVKIRKSLGLSQIQLAILFGIPVGNIRNWEQSRRGPDASAIALYRVIKSKDQGVLEHMVVLASQEKYSELKEVTALKELIGKIIKNELLRSMLELRLLEVNSHWTPEEMGFRLTRVSL